MSIILLLGCVYSSALFGVLELALMAEQFESLAEKHTQFIEQQHLFFVATAASEGSINLSPKGTDCLRVINSNTVVWLNLTGSGNETAAHLIQKNRMTLMFCSFSKLVILTSWPICTKPSSPMTKRYRSRHRLTQGNRFGSH